MTSTQIREFKEERLKEQIADLQRIRTAIGSEIAVYYNSDVSPDCLALAQSFEIICREERVALAALDSVATSDCTESTPVNE